MVILYEDILKKRSQLDGRNKAESKDRLTIYERLEQIANNVYATDSVTDIANWIVNKPKAYRILYDAEHDIWGIADAKNITHMQIAREFYKSGYVVVPDNYIAKARELLGMESSRPEDVFAKDAFYGNGKVYAIIFLPSDIEYGDYEEQYFYGAETLLNNGSIFTKRRDYFSENGPLKDLYIKLKRMGEISGKRRPLDDVAKAARENGFSSFENSFMNRAVEAGYSVDEVNNYLRSLPEHSLVAMFEKYFKTYGLKRAADFLRTKAKQIGYSKKEIEDFLSDMFD